MSDFYTNVKQWGDSILYRGVKNGKKVQVKIPYQPSLFVPTNEESPYKTLYGEPLQKIKFETIKKSKEFIEKHKDVANFKIFGNTKYEYCAISDIFKDEVQWDMSKIRVAIFDIEVNSDPETGGFASPENPFQPITSIALKFLGEDKFYLLGYHEFDAPDNVRYFRCKDEWTLLKTFIEIWSTDYPDIATGYNSSGFDIPYLINRCYKIIGEPETKKLSPWKLINERKSRKFNPRFNQYEEEITYSIIGISSLDYLELFKKYHPEGKSQESYKLDFIAENEIGEKKVDYEGSLHKLYTEDKQKFYLYNLKDVDLIEKLDNKHKLFELALTLAYDSKCNFEDVFAQSRMWDTIIYEHLKYKNIQMPPNKDVENVEYVGAYVKAPITGIHKWIATIDAASLYPSLIVGQNISVETLIEPKDQTPEMRSAISKGVCVNSLLDRKIDLEFLYNQKATLCPNGQFFRTDKKGFIPEIIEHMMLKRREYKNIMLEKEAKLELVLAQILRLEK